MKRDVIDRYERAPDGGIMLDVAAASVEDLYEDFDKSAPYIRRDLDQDLVDYLIDCARELGKESFTISFTLAAVTDEAKILRTRRSVNIFFLYLAELEQQKVRRMFRRSLVLLGIGLVILFISVWVNQSVVSEDSVMSTVFGEGLTIIAWVSMWEALAIFFIEWFPHRAKIRLYRRLAHAPLIFRLNSEATRGGTT